ncbi:hypothetical protein PVK06_043421 [Gossypium arboreum]|uniref:Uncharacterized protein n=1 Tax=Gossypium arboreum TaxID=29729 RepID=A0ABR0MNP5_GOSAR|nr:hypothetical protein PVK06_043421 [Gossypium arboreum]
MAIASAKLRCDIWSTKNRLFAAATRAKVSRITHELHSIKKRMLSIKEYMAKIQNTCTLLEASGSVVPEVENVKIILAGLSSEFDMKLVDVLMELESRQARAVTNVSFHTHLVEAASLTPVVEPMCGGCPLSSGHGRGFRPRLQCQGGQSVRPNAGAGPYFGANMPSTMGLHYWPSSLGLVGAHKPPTSSHGVGPYSRLAPMDLILGQSSGPECQFCWA